MSDAGTEDQGGEDEDHHHLLASRQKEHPERINRVSDHASAGRDGIGNFIQFCIRNRKTRDRRVNMVRNVTRLEGGSGMP
jgi:hypothetical protein